MVLTKKQLVDAIAKLWAYNTVQSNYRHVALQESLSTSLELYEDFVKYLKGLPYAQLEKIYRDDIVFETHESISIPPVCPQARV